MHIYLTSCPDVYSRGGVLLETRDNVCIPWCRYALYNYVTHAEVLLMSCHPLLMCT